MERGPFDCFPVSPFFSGFLELFAVFIRRRPRPFRVQDSFFFAQEIIDVLEIGQTLKQNARERDGFISESERARTGARRIRSYVFSEQVVGGAAAAGLVLLPDQGGQEPVLIHCEFHAQISRAHPITP